MFRSYWGKFSKIAGLAALVWLAFGFYSALSWHSNGLENEAAQRTEIHRQNAEDRIVRVCASDPAKIKCIYEARQTQRENEREEQDLAAQKVTAWWTKTMGIAALIGMALSAVGVWLVKTTFDETRKANEIAKETLFRQLRAYVTAESIETDENNRLTKYSGFSCVKITINNSGATPANSVKIIYSRISVKEGEIFPLLTEECFPNIGGQTKIIAHIPWLFWDNLYDPKVRISTNISGVLVYNTVIPDANGHYIEFSENFDLKVRMPNRIPPVEMRITSVPERTFFS